MIDDMFQRLCDICVIKHNYIINTHAPTSLSQRVAYLPNPTPEVTTFLKFISTILFPFKTVLSHIYVHLNHIEFSFAC